MFLEKSVLKICNKFTGEHTCQSAISIKLLYNFIEIARWHGCSVNLLHVFRTPFSKNSSEGLLLLGVFWLLSLRILTQLETSIDTLKYSTKLLITDQDPLLQRKSSPVRLKLEKFENKDSFYFKTCKNTTNFSKQLLITNKVLNVGILEIFKTTLMQ